jgi:hypothetical protein
VLRFEETDQALVLNKTNAATLSDAFGDESDNWIGKAVLLCAETTTYGGKTVGCVRIRLPRGNKNAAASIASTQEDDTCSDVV